MTTNAIMSVLAPEDRLIAPVPLENKWEEMPLPQSVQSFLLMAIFTLLIFYTLYFTSAVVLPIIFAIVLNLLLQPSMRWLVRLHLPRVAAAVLMITMLFGGLTVLGLTLSGPASGWIAKAPEGLPYLEKRLAIFKKPVESVQKASKQVEAIGADPARDVRTVTVKGPGLTSFLFSGTRTLLAGLLTTITLLFFLLVSGDMFLRRLVEILPTLSEKKQAVDIAHEIESNISAYLVTISLMNAAVGLATGIATYFCGLADPILWGSVAFLLNYVPIVGPLVGLGILVLAGLLTFDPLWQAVLPAAIYLVIHVVEGQSITPILLARRFILNPVLVIVALVFWYWMWGVAGALLAVPMLATFKIVCDRIRPLMAFGHFLGAEARSAARAE
jgi:predicted PurR-regulated permease PerM